MKNIIVIKNEIANKPKRKLRIQDFADDTICMPSIISLNNPNSPHYNPFSLGSHCLLSDLYIEIK